MSYVFHVFENSPVKDYAPTYIPLPALLILPCLDALKTMFLIFLSSNPVFLTNALL